MGVDRIGLATLPAVYTFNDWSIMHSDLENYCTRGLLMRPPLSTWLRIQLLLEYASPQAPRIPLCRHREHHPDIPDLPVKYRSNRGSALQIRSQFCPSSLTRDYYDTPVGARFADRGRLDYRLLSRVVSDRSRALGY